MLELSEQTARDFPLRREIRWEWVDKDDGSGRVIVPTLPIHPFLYRGQNRHFQPCWPSICRGFQSVSPSAKDLDHFDQLLLIKRLAQERWFESVLDEHPAVRWASQEQIDVNRPAVAQHYGIPTPFIDLTESFDVAGFFATCYFNRDANAWRPCATGEGVFYRLSWRDIPPTPKRIGWIGLHPLPRPAEQWAWTCELFLGEDFEAAPSLQGFRFTHNERVGDHFLTMFEGGEALFPSDPLARVAHRINDGARMPEWALTETIADIVGDPQGLQGQDERALLTEIQDRCDVAAEANCPSPMTPADAAELDSIWNKRKDDFLKGVTFRLVRTRRPDP